MRKCARCFDFLKDHTCLSCHLRHQCLEKDCECHQYPNLPFCFGHNYTYNYGRDVNSQYKKIYAVNAKDNITNSRRYKDKLLSRKIGAKQFQKKLEGLEKEERSIHG